MVEQNFPLRRLPTKMLHTSFLSTRNIPHNTKRLHHLSVLKNRRHIVLSNYNLFRFLDKSKLITTGCWFSTKRVSTFHPTTFLVSSTEFERVSIEDLLSVDLSLRSNFPRRSAESSSKRTRTSSKPVLIFFIGSLYDMRN